MKVIKIVSNVIFIGILIITITMIVAIYGFKIKPVVVVSGSMEPVVKTGSLCFVNFNDKDVENGDIIAYDGGSVMVIHRIVSTNGKSFITKGDANDYEDPVAVSKGMVKGKYMFSIPEAGKLLLRIKSLYT